VSKPEQDSLKQKTPWVLQPATGLLLGGIALGSGATLLGVWFARGDASLLVAIVFGALSSIFALLQFGVANASLAAANKIAGDQAARADAAESKRKIDFISVVCALANEAIFEADNASVALKAGSLPNGILGNLHNRLIEIRGALEPIRSAAPPDAQLILDVSKLSRAMDFPSLVGMDSAAAELLVGQHHGSLCLALGEVRKAL